MGATDKTRNQLAEQASNQLACQPISHQGIHWNIRVRICSWRRKQRNVRIQKYGKGDKIK